MIQTPNPEQALSVIPEKFRALFGFPLFLAMFHMILKKLAFFTLMALGTNAIWAQTDKKPEGPANTEDEYEKRYKERITKDRLHGVYIPRNLDDAFTTLDKNTTQESRDKIKSIEEDSICIYLHDRLGRWMIQNWCFYEGSRFSHYLRTAGVTYPDDMADFTLIAYHRYLNKKPVELKELVISFKEKRKKEFEEEKKKRKVISEEIKKKTPPKDSIGN